MFFLVNLHAKTPLNTLRCRPQCLGIMKERVEKYNFSPFLVKRGSTVVSLTNYYHPDKIFSEHFFAKFRFDESRHFIFFIISAKFRKPRSRKVKIRGSRLEL